MSGSSPSLISSASTVAAAMTSASAGLLLTPTFGHLVNIKLGRDHFLLWKAKLMPYLRGQQLLGFVDGTNKAPLPTVSQVMTEEMCSQVLNLTTSAEVWTTLKRMLSSQSKARIMQMDQDRLTRKTLLRGKCEGGLYPLQLNPSTSREVLSAARVTKEQCHWGYKRFFRRTALETSDFLKDDCLKINCTVGVVVSTMDFSRPRSIQVPESDIGYHFGTLLDTQEGVDVIFSVSGEKFHAHKLVLAARSSFFRSEFFDRESDEEKNEVDTSNEIKEIVIDDMEPKVFKAVLHFMYRDNLVGDDELSASSSDCSIFDTLAGKLLAAADKYELQRLRVLCESYLCKHISVNSVATTLALADRHHAMELKSVCLKFAAENLSAVIRTNGFDYLKDNCPSLQSEILRTVAGCEEECSSSGKSQSVWGQLSDGGDTSGRRVRPRV